jgi:hypothetical protein
VKSLLALFFVFSGSTFASDLDATDALLSTLPAGEYSGFTLKKLPCSVSVRVLSNRVAVVATDSDLTKRSEVYNGAVYRLKPGKREFLASVLTTTLTDKRENFVRTIAVTENTQYVVVGDIISSSARDKQESVVECIVNL